MATIAVTAERDVAAPSDAVYGHLADMRERARFLPPAFSDFHVETGGVGAGTVASFTVTLAGRTRRYRMTVTEPSPGVLTESDANSTLVTTFTVSPGDGATHVRISTTWEGASGVGGVFERTFAPRILRRLYDDELRRLDAFAVERALENARVEESDEESFPASDPPAI